MRKVQGKIRNIKAKRENRRKLSIRKKVIGSEERPRLCVVKSNKHLAIQVINDATRKTLFSVQTYGKNKVDAKRNVEGAKIVGAKVGEALKAKKITRIVFDRNGKRFGTLLAALANSIREQGIQF